MTAPISSGFLQRALAKAEGDAITRRPLVDTRSQKSRLSAAQDSPDYVLRAEKDLFSYSDLDKVIKRVETAIKMFDGKEIAIELSQKLELRAVAIVPERTALSNLLLTYIQKENPTLDGFKVFLEFLSDRLVNVF